MEKFRQHLEKVQAQENRKKEERSVFLAEQLSRAAEKEDARMAVLDEQARVKAIRLEKAKQKQAILEESWQSTVGSQQHTENNGTYKKVKTKKGSKQGKDESEEGGEKEEGVSALFDKMDDDSSGDEEEVQAMFDSEDEHDAAEEKKKLAADHEAKVKDVFGSDGDSSDDEEEFNAEADVVTTTATGTSKIINQGGRLKRSLNTSDEEEGELDLSSGEVNQTNGDVRGEDLKEEEKEKEETGEEPARQRRKVISDDDEEEED